VSPNLDRISVKARAHPDLVFTSLYHHIADIEHLRTCFRLLQGNKAVGVDEVTKAMYAEDLEANLQDLSARLKRMGYRPQPKRRVYIPKPGSEKGRPLGMSSFEDKMVELATKRVLEPLFEPLFEDCSYGYRPKRSPHQCLDALGRTIQQKRVNHLVEADIRSFFDAVNHEWLLKFLRQRIGDNRVLRLIRRMLKAGIMEEGLVQATEVGTPQGSILSPLLSNVYLHYVLDLWFQRRVRRHCRGEAYLFRFADDFLACFQSGTEAEAFRESLGHRMEEFQLELAEEKTRHLEFGRYARANAYRNGGKPQEFTFLGMTFFCGKTRYGAFKVKRKTSRKKLQQSLARFTDWLRRFRNLLPTGDLLRQAKTRVQGHLNYYAITDNSESCQRYMHLTRRALFKWLNRRSQRKSYTWDGFLQVLRQVDWPQVRVRVNLNPFAPLNG
jgi:RNA-directed DNA polymerase